MANKIFNSIQVRKPKRSTFDLSYYHKLSLKMGELVPFHIQECVPGDKFWISSEGLFRMMPMLSPIMHKVERYQQFFFVPIRILWDGWESFISGSQNGAGPDVPVNRPFPVMDYAVLANVLPSSHLGSSQTIFFDTPQKALH